MNVEKFRVPGGHREYALPSENFERTDGPINDPS
jgi:hypothetical protein